jgi:hypothetical protein
LALLDGERSVGLAAAPPQIATLRPSFVKCASIILPYPRMTAKFAHVVDMAKKNPALSIPVKVG